jgi:hypothetical protein
MNPNILYMCIYYIYIYIYVYIYMYIQKAAGILIHLLISTGDLYNAERFGEITYSNLRNRNNGMDLESEEVANGAYNLANVLIRQDDGDRVKAEALARESLRIRTKIFGADHHNACQSCGLLANIFMSEGNVGEETKKLFVRYLINLIKSEGPDGINTAVGNADMGRYYKQFAEIQSTVALKKKQLLLAQSYLEKAIQTRTRIYGSVHPDTVRLINCLAPVLRDISRI